MTREVDTSYNNRIRDAGFDREILNRRIVFNVEFPSKLRDLKNYPAFNDGLSNENYTRTLVEQLLSEFREEKERFNLEEEKYKRERIRQELLLSVASTESIYSILKATAPLNAQGEPEITPEYETYMAGMIADSLRSELGSMTKSDLKRWAGLYPEYPLVTGLVGNRVAQEELIKAKFGKLPGDLTGAELDKLANEHNVEVELTKNTSLNIDIPNLDIFGIADDVKSITSDLKEIFSIKPVLIENLRKDYNKFNLSA